MSFLIRNIQSAFRSVYIQIHVYKIGDFKDFSYYLGNLDPRKSCYLGQVMFLQGIILFLAETLVSTSYDND